jgi:hypothetical protein
MTHKDPTNIVLSYILQLSRYSDGLWAGRLGFDSQQRQELFLHSTASRPALEPTQPLIQWVLGTLFSGGKQPRSEAYYSSPPSTEVKSGEAVPPFPVRLHAVMLNSLSTGTFLPRLISYRKYWQRCAVRCRRLHKLFVTSYWSSFPKPQTALILSHDHYQLFWLRTSELKTQSA